MKIPKCIEFQKDLSNEGMFVKTPLLGCKKLGPNMQSFSSSFLSGKKWPSEMNFKTLKLDPQEQFMLSKVHYKESFGCLRAIGLTSKRFSQQQLETPVFEAGRLNRM